MLLSRRRHHALTYVPAVAGGLRPRGETARSAGLTEAGHNVAQLTLHSLIRMAGGRRVSKSYSFLWDDADLRRNADDVARINLDVNRYEMDVTRFGVDPCKVDLGAQGKEIIPGWIEMYP